ncbi:glycosyltransferase family 4 protein [Actinomarinicola tropica]|uniref:Glycosyltransferase n=1 Tax=Actinomarinicola tropica TaxID=2789776 RepID=A0A5Q2RP01_9ACTN|nr:glycosyltransferase family 4 protein [Actinomarinicola tropica]QGG95827.1 glycosyltransferase [Actinomarinicola tropica]
MRVTIVNQFFPPDLSPTAHLAASLARHRASRGDEVTVVTSTGGYVADPAAGTPHRSGSTVEDGLRIIRLPTPGGGKSSLVTRLAGYAALTVGAWVRTATLPRQDVVVCMTTPPYIVLAGLLHKALHRRTRVVLWSMDVYPDTAERFDKLDPSGPLSRALRAVNRWLYPRLDHLVVLDSAMADVLVSQYAAEDPPPTTVVPNWEPAELFPAGAVVEPWAGYDDAQLAGRFVVAYLGNTGTGHRFDAVVEAAGRLDGSEVAFLFVGGGVRWGELDSARHALARSAAAPIVLHGYVDKAETPGILAGAGAALITLDDRARGLMSPSKLHSSLAAGVPILYVGPEGTNVDDAIRRHGCGVSIRNGDVDGLVAAIERLRTDDDHRAELSAAARRAFEADHSDASALPRFDAVIDG